MTQLPPFIYIRAGSASDSSLFLMDSLLFTVPGSLPDGCILPHIVCGGGGVKPGGARMGEHQGIPVFGVDIPAHVFTEMVHGIRFMDLLPDMYRHVPQSLKSAGMSLYVWRRYLAHYGLALEAANDAEDDKEDYVAKKARERAAKRAKLEEDPRGQLLKRTVMALAAKIKAEHPKWTAFSTGVEVQLCCIFVSTYDPTEDGDYTFFLSIPGDPPVSDPVRVAWALGRGLSSNGHGWGIDFDKIEIREDAIEEWILVGLELPNTFTASFTTIRKHESKAKHHDRFRQWPASPDGQEVELTPGSHDILRLNISPKPDV